MKHAQSAILAALVFVANAYPYSDSGHKAVALIAWDHLPANGAAQKEIARLSAALKEAFGSSQDISERLASASMWPDSIKHRVGPSDVSISCFPGLRYDSSGHGQPPKLQPITKGSHTANLHFADFDASESLVCGPADCVITAVAKARAVLRDKNVADKTRAEALAFLVHLVGDAHQPLHAGFVEDVGGNTITLKQSRADNLHALWDDGLFVSQGIESPQLLVDSIKTHQLLQQLGNTTEPDDLDPRKWIIDSHALAKKNAYVFPSGARVKKGSKITAAYIKVGFSVDERRVALAGLRLAKILEEDLTTNN